MSDKKIRLTDAAEAALKDAAERYSKEVLDVISTNKFIPGSEFIEVTAQDVTIAAEILRNGDEVNRRKQVKKRYTVLFSILYLMLGGGSFVYGLFNPQIQQFFSEGAPERQLYVILGLTLCAIGLILPVMNWLRDATQALRGRFSVSATDDGRRGEK